MKQKQRLVVFADRRLVEAVRREQERLELEQGLDVSVSAAAAALMRRGAGQDTRGQAA